MCVCVIVCVFPCVRARIRMLLECENVGLYVKLIVVHLTNVTPYIHVYNKFIPTLSDIQICTMLIFVEIVYRHIKDGCHKNNICLFMPEHFQN